MIVVRFVIHKIYDLDNKSLIGLDSHIVNRYILSHTIWLSKISD